MLSCRSCASTDLAPILDLGTQPPANAYLAALDEPEVRYPLALAFCHNCGLAQLRDAQPPGLFRNYRYLTGASAAARQYWADYAAQAIIPRLSPGDLVVDVGGNDGTLLAALSNQAANGKLRRINVDPAANLAEMNEERGIEFWPAALDQETAEDIVEYHGPARVVCANNVLAHTDDPRSLLKAIATLLGEEGTLIVEVHWARHLVRAGCWDQIYHEHACYYSLHALVPLLRSCGLAMIDAQVVPGQGQSLRIFARSIDAPCSSTYGTELPHVMKIVEQEYAACLHEEWSYLALSWKAEDTKYNIINLLQILKLQGKHIVGYGAPAKGNTLLNYCQIGPAQLDYLTDTTPLKQGLFAPGSRLPIRDPGCLRDDPPDYALLLAWNHRDAILSQERELQARGMRFITAMSRVEILDPAREAAA